MLLISFLILFPLAVAAVMLLVHNERVRRYLVYGSAAIIAIASLYLVFSNLGTQGVYFTFSSKAVDIACTMVGVAIAACVLAFAFKYKNLWAGLIASVQLVASLVFDFGFSGGIEVESGFYFDSLSVLMVFIIGVIGSGVCIYALGYMEDFQKEHADDKDRRPLFFAAMFLLLSGMYLIVFSNNMTWMFTGWEITTICSFLMIGYTRTEEAIRNAFRQIIMNIAGGIGFIAALYYCAIAMGTLSFSDFLQMGVLNASLVAFPLTCLAFASITKSAQMPFHSWLLGAMVAPTPTSALLHSSTMVKAGVFLLIKMAPLFALSLVPSLMVILVGGITFCLASFIAVSQSNAKRVLAYSTISNLGLIVACAGVGTAEAVWAGMFLILFHACAKSLLFQCVGTAEHHIGSRNIEDMDLLFERMPRLARIMMLGIMGMFIAPFGMLISKWATLVSFVDTHQIALIILLAFGSAATFMFWAKWLGKLSGIAGSPKNVETTVHRSEWIAMGIMAVLVAACCIGLPFINDYAVMPYIHSVYGMITTDIGNDVLTITSILSAVVLVVVFVGLGHSKAKKVPVYLAGVSVDNDKRVFQSSLSQEATATSRNLYLTDLFGAKKITPVGVLSCSIIIVIAFVVSVSTMLMLF